ncbi:MAG: AI-2E family transporter [Thiolinea sp.]
MKADHCNSLKIPLWGLFVIALMSVLYLAKSVFIPIFLATLIAFLLSPPVNALTRYYVPRSLGSAIVITLASGLITLSFYYLAEPVGLWVERLPTEVQQIERKLSPFKDSIETVQETTKKVENIASIDNGEQDKAPNVVVTGPNIFYTLLNSTQAFLIGVLSFLVLLYFMLAFGHSLTLKASSFLQKKADKTRMIRIARDVQHKLSRYLLLITLLNIILGAVVTLVMWLVGMPTPVVWGASAAVLNYIPYVGPAINIALIALVSLLTFEHLAQILLPPALLLVLNLLEGQLIQPMFVGRMFTINPVLVFLFVLIWGWLWGMAGIFMAVPLLVIIKIILDQLAEPEKNNDSEATAQS